MAIKKVTEVADWYGVNPITIRRWIKEGLPIKEAGKAGVTHKLDTVAVHEWLIDRAVKKHRTTATGDQYIRIEEEARLKHHQANLATIQEREMEAGLF